MPEDCKNCPDHGALSVQIEHIQNELKEYKENMKNLVSQISELKTEILKLENREKLMIGIFALAGTVVSSLGSIIGCVITAYLK